MDAPREQLASARALLAMCEERGMSLATAESLTGGMLVARLVDVPGASRVVQGVRARTVSKRRRLFWG